MTFEDLLAEAEAEPVEGWDFSWFDGRATEERPSWGYARLLADRMSQARAGLDLQTGGGEVLAEIPSPPSTLVAAETWPPNAAIAAANLRHLGGRVVLVTEGGGLPFAGGTFDLVTSRHPTALPWPEIARVLAPGGTFLAQCVGHGSNRELSEAMMGSLPPARERATAEASAAAGLTVVDAREEWTRVEFFDIGAVAYFLRKVFWTVPDFTIARYRARLAALDQRIRAEGWFVAHSRRYLIEARKPA
ncbi:Methyltransferase domain-containing protein [Amycolatopsis xylanica]|uniref:Methyltransferase domain-containing protein n=1 Tax=Amycolatopsis xylanica TaxID=589385 RepID=A0A1H3GPG7_9PSEU|nr:methyltransferase domain-containing protein [Amycolatopsis xylanica]SDY04875.1 Methyltransferase domain-containing protein [Amycolatopsis xylanica]